ncbi:MAG: UPF0175 family protein [archaeon]
MRTELVSIRLPKEEVKVIIERAKEEHTDKTTAIRRTLALGAKQYLLNKAFEEYKQGKISLGKTAETTGLSLWEIMEEAKTRNIPNPLTKQEFKEGLKNLEKVWKK